MTKRILLGLLMLIFLSAPHSLAQEKPSAELLQKGKELFNKKLPGAKVACISCHRGAKVIKKSEISKLSADQLPDVINKYVVKKSKGKPIAKDSDDMKALAAFIVHEHAR